MTAPPEHKDKSITEEQPPYGEIAESLKRGEVIPFLGAGVNYGTRPPNTQWDNPNTAMFLPDGGELSRYLAHYTSFPADKNNDSSDLAKVASYYEATNGRPKLNRRLQMIFNKDFTSAEIHTYLAEIARQMPPNSDHLLIITTNYDDLTEQAFQKLKVPYDLVVHLTGEAAWEGSVLWGQYDPKRPQDFQCTTVPPQELAKYADLKQRTIIYKMHGTVDRLNKWNSYVITEDDYVKFLSRMSLHNNHMVVPGMLIQYFPRRHFLFLGYALRDWNLRVLLKNLPEHLDVVDDFPSWSIQFKPSLYDKALWIKKNVKIYNVDINEFVRQLRAF